MTEFHERIEKYNKRLNVMTREELISECLSKHIDVQGEIDYRQHMMKEAEKAIKMERDKNDK